MKPSPLGVRKTMSLGIEYGTLDTISSPLVDALGLHQEPPGGESLWTEAGKLVTRPMLLDKVPTYRKYNPDVVSTTPSITVFVVTKNNVDTIVKCVDSVLLQTFRDFQIDCL